LDRGRSSNALFYSPGRMCARYIQYITEEHDSQSAKTSMLMRIGRENIYSHTYMHICVYTHTHACIYKHTHIYACMYIHTYISEEHDADSTQASMLTCVARENIYVHTYVYIYAYTYMHAYIHTHICAGIYMYIYAHIYITEEQDAESAKASMLTRVARENVHTHKYICTHAHIYTHTHTCMPVYIHAHIYHRGARCRKCQGVDADAR